MNQSPRDSTGERAFESPIAVSKDDCQWGMLAHLTLLTWILSAGLGFLLGPLVVWLMKKDESAFVDANGREALNFGINLVGWGIVSFLLAITVILFPVAIVIWVVMPIFAIVMPIIAGLKAKDGYSYRYPFLLRVL